MILMKSPSLAINSCDVPGPSYHMWRTINAFPGYTVSNLVNDIISNNALARAYQNASLENIIINCHGWDGGGGLSIGGIGNQALTAGNVIEFTRIKKLNLGTIWLVACQAAKGEGKELCLNLARFSGCQVVASEEDQDVGVWEGFRVATHPNNVDEYEGTTYLFTPVGFMREVDPHAPRDLYTVLE